MKRTAALTAFGLMLALAAGAAEAASPVMPLSEVKAGMTGRGRTVFEGGRIEEFEARVLGVLRNVQQPGRSVILARLSGRGLESTGVISGMSGSPVYVDGKIIGAVAFSFAFSKEAVAGITPIEEMLAIDDGAPSRSPASPPLDIPLSGSLSLEDLARAFQEAYPPPRAAAADGRTLRPLHVPLVFSGFSAGGFERAQGFFAPLGFQPVLGGTSGQLKAPAAAAAGPARLTEGDAVAMQLVSGDIDVSAVGTVTYVDGDKVFAFGHPFYNLGAVDYGMARAEVLTVVSSLDSSFKMAAAGPIIGRFSQDRTPGAFGEIGRMPEMIPFNVSLQDGPASRREFKFQVIDDRILTPALVNMTLYSLITGEERIFGDLALDFDGDIFLNNGTSIHFEDLFSGNYNLATTSLTGLIASVLYLLKNNEFEDVGIFRVDLRIRSVEEPRLCVLEKVLLDKYEASPGEPIQARIFYRTRDAGTRVEEVAFPAPGLPPGSEFQVVVGDAATMTMLESSRLRAGGVTPRSVAQLVRLLGSLRKNNRIYFKILAAKPGLFLRGEEMPNLPPSLKSMFTSPRAAASSPTELSRSTLSEYQLPVPYVFQGSAVVPVRIRRP